MLNSNVIQDPFYEDHCTAYVVFREGLMETLTS
jgi:hypothetical protein